MDSGGDDRTLEQRFESFDTYSMTPAMALSLFAEGRQHCPVPHSNRLGGFHLLLTFDHVRKGLLDWRRLKNGPAVLRPPKQDVPRLPPFDFDDEEHGAWRKIFLAGINPQTARRIEPLVRRDVIEAIDAFAGKGECDLVAHLAERIPLLALFHVLGLDEENIPFVRTITLDLLASADDPARFKEFFAEFAKFGEA